MKKISWFKTIWLSSEERKALQKGFEQLEKELDPPKELAQAIKKSEGAPYKTLIYNNGNLTVIMHSNQVISKVVDEDTFKLIQQCTTEDDLYILLSETVTEEKKEDLAEKHLVNDNLRILRSHSDFSVIGDKAFMKGVNIEMPYPVTSSFIEILEKLHSLALQEDSGTEDEKDDLLDSYNALKMFWLKLALNPKPKSRENLLNFVKYNDVKITRNGNIVLYRKIVKVNDTANQELIAYISQQYSKVKGWKKSPKNFKVLADLATGKSFKLVAPDISVSDYQPIGVLKDLYDNLESMKGNKFTSQNNKGRYTIKIGSVYKMDESIEQIDLDDTVCHSGGLHAASVNYSYGGYGDTPVVVLVSPSKAIAVPTYDMGKLRVTEMFIAAINDQPHGKHFDEGALSGFDEEYNNYTVEELEEAIKNQTPEEAGYGKSSSVQLVDLEAIKTALSTRIKQVS